MSTGLMMMLKSLGIDPKMIENVAIAVQNAANDLHIIKTHQQFLIKQNQEILARLRELTPAFEMPIASELIPQLPVEVSSNGG